MSRITIQILREDGNVKLKYSLPNLAERFIVKVSNKGPKLPFVTELDDTAKKMLFGELAPEAKSKGNLAKHLLDVLIDPAEQANIISEGNPVDLAIEMAFDDPLTSIPWELVLSAYVGAKTLAQLEITVTRLIRCETPAPQAFDRPIKILFVSGTPIDDPAVKAGTEFYCIARSFTLNKRPFRTKLVIHATLDELAAAANELKPHIIHFAGHGEFGAGGASILLRDPTPGKDAVNVTPTQLIAKLDGALPTMVILSACQTGTAQPYGASECASFAAQLVKSGIPIVAAMSGKITDLATRTFSRSLMAALVNGEPIVSVTGKARKAVFNVVDASGEWAYPGLFCAPSVPVDHVLASKTMSPAEKILQKRIKSFTELEHLEPALCMREDALTTYVSSMNGTGRAATFMFGDSDMGKSKTLRELGRQAIREGHLAIKVNPVCLTGAPPELERRLADMFAAGLSDAARDLELSGEWKPKLLNYLRIKGFDNILDMVSTQHSSSENSSHVGPLDKYLVSEDVLAELEKGYRYLRKACVIFEFELGQLRDLAAQKGLLPSYAKSVVLIDDMHELPDEFWQTIFVSDGTITIDGFRIIGTEPVPLIATAHLNKVTESQRSQIEGKRLANSIEFGTFPEKGDEDMKAYEKVLLTPFRPVGCDVDGGDKVHALIDGFFDDPSPNALRTKKLFRKLVGGIPRKLSEPELYLAAESAVGFQKMTQSSEYALLKGVKLWEAEE